MSLPGVLVSPVQADGPALDARTCFPHEQTLGKGGLLILCSFLRLIIHSTASSCYRCPALHPCSSHWGLTLKKTLLMVICPEGRRKHFGHFRTAATATTSYLYNIMLKIVKIQFWWLMSSQACSYQVCVSKWGFWPAINEKRACGCHIHHDVSLRTILKYIYIMLMLKIKNSHWGNRQRHDWFGMSKNLIAIKAHMVKTSLTQPF